MPITIEKTATRSAKNAVLSAVVSAVSVTHVAEILDRAAVVRLAARASSLVSSPDRSGSGPSRHAAHPPSTRACGAP